MDLIIFAHPDRGGSHNALVLKYVQNRLRAARRECHTIDLYAEKFDPLLRVVEEARGDGTRYSAEMRKYQDLIARAQRLIFIYPAWWYNLPAVLKGFVDRTFTSGFAYDIVAGREGGPGVVPKLRGKKAVVINTYGFGAWLYEKQGGVPALAMDRAVLEFCGIETKRVNWFDVRPGAGMPKEVQEAIDAALG